MRQDLCKLDLFAIEFIFVLLQTNALPAFISVIASEYKTYKYSEYGIHLDFNITSTQVTARSIQYNTEYNNKQVPIHYSETERELN